MQLQHLNFYASHGNGNAAKFLRSGKKYYSYL